MAGEAVLREFGKNTCGPSELSFKHSNTTPLLCSVRIYKNYWLLSEAYLSLDFATSVSCMILISAGCVKYVPDFVVVLMLHTEIHLGCILRRGTSESHARMVHRGHGPAQP